MVRDHIYSRKSGFENGVYPEIIRHPCNCQILTHAENVAKKKYRYIDEDQISLEKLFEKIEGYTGEWPEHTATLEKIGLYKQGNKYDPTKYIRDQ